MKVSTLGVNGASVAIDLAGSETLVLQASGTFSLTAQMECSVDGQNWTALGMTPSSGAAIATSLTAAGIWSATVRGYTSARVRVSAYTSGNLAVNLEVR